MTVNWSRGQEKDSRGQYTGPRGKILWTYHRISNVCGSMTYWQHWTDDEVIIMHWQVQVPSQTIIINSKLHKPIQQPTFRRPVTTDNYYVSPTANYHFSCKYSAAPHGAKTRVQCNSIKKKKRHTVHVNASRKNTQPPGENPAQWQRRHLISTNPHRGLLFLAKGN